MKLIFIDYKNDRPTVMDLVVYRDLHPWIAEWMRRERAAAYRREGNYAPDQVVALPDHYTFVSDPDWLPMEFTTLQ